MDDDDITMEQSESVTEAHIRKTHLIYELLVRQ